MPKIDISAKELKTRKLFVATPMYGGMCAGPYMKACLDLAATAAKFGVQCQFFFLFNESLITRARNYLVDEFLRSDATHLMFIDSDIEFNAMDVIALLALDKPINGGPYPKKTIAWEKVFDAVKLGLCDTNPMLMEQYAGDYVFNVPAEVKEIKMDETTEVLELGTGFMLIRRDVFEAFRKAYPELSYRPDHNRTKEFDGSREIHAYFDTVIDPVSKRYLSEDYMFCQWVRNLGIKVYICPWMNLAHAGTYIFRGNLAALANLSHLQQQRGHATPVMRSLDETVTPPATPVAETAGGDAAC